MLAEVAGGPNGARRRAGRLPDTCATTAAPSTPVDVGGVIVPGRSTRTRYHGGLIQRLDADGSVHDLYTNCAGRPLRAPNDLVLDAHGGFWFTDHGIVDGQARTSDLSAHLLRPLRRFGHPRGGLSRRRRRTASACQPDGETLYYAETFTGRIFRRRVVEPGVLADASPFDASTLLYSLPGLQYLDSLAVDGEGWVCVGTLLQGGITCVSPDGQSVEVISTGDPITTNLCFGGPELRTAYVTLSGTGRVVTLDWPRPGLAAGATSSAGRRRGPSVAWSRCRNASTSRPWGARRTRSTRTSSSARCSPTAWPRPTTRPPPTWWWSTRARSSTPPGSESIDTVLALDEVRQTGSPPGGDRLHGRALRRRAGRRRCRRSIGSPASGSASSSRRRRRRSRRAP